MLDNFAKPDEVRLTQGEDGEIEEEYYEDLENTFLFERMRETLIYLTHIDMFAMNSLIQKRLEDIKRPEFFTMERLNKLCWALGSISGCMSEEEENKFAVQTIKELLNLCESAKGKSAKAQIATDIMYVVGSFPKFLCGNWTFLKTVFNKLIEFMKETHPGV
jgi:exportin-1